jgi:hypothetical protein
VQLVSATRVRILGRVDVRGEHGGSHIAELDSFIIGGGAGGGVLVEAPVVELGSAARILANGGGGASTEFTGGDGEQTAAPGAICELAGCGTGGNGAAAGIEATAGQDQAYQAIPQVIGGGGGGGGLGRLRINSADGSYMKSATTIEVAVTTSGVLRRR